MPLTTTSACHNQISLLWGLEELPLRQAFRHNTARTSLLVGPPEYINHLLRFSMTRFRFWPHQRLDLLSVLLDSLLGRNTVAGAAKSSCSAAHVRQRSSVRMNVFAAFKLEPSPGGVGSSAMVWFVRASTRS